MFNEIVERGLCQYAAWTHETNFICCEKGKGAVCTVACEHRSSKKQLPIPVCSGPITPIRLEQDMHSRFVFVPEPWNFANTAMDNFPFISFIVDFPMEPSFIGGFQLPFLLTRGYPCLAKPV